MAAIAGADNPSPSIAERLRQLEESAATIERRIGEIDGDAAAVEQSAVDPGNVAATLAEFTELWDVLYPKEKTSIVHLLVERLVYNGDEPRVRIVFHACISLRPQDQLHPL